MLMTVILIISIVFNILMFHIIMLKWIKLTKKKKERIQNMEESVNQKLSEMVSFSNRFSNIISGINHEVSPWFGGVTNITYFLQLKLKEPEIDREEIHTLLNRIDDACNQGAEVLGTLSKNVKKLQKYSTYNSSIGDTVLIWGQVTLIDKTIKSYLDSENIDMSDITSLCFNAKHSPMLLTQVIYNIVKNAVDHNKDYIEDLKIKFWGNGKDELYIEDNGKGIEPNILKDIFSPGFTTKKQNPSQHGIGLATCINFCNLMDADIRVESEVGKFTRFIIKFDTSLEPYTDRISGAYDKKEGKEIILIKSKYKDLSNKLRTPAVEF